jgi:transcriptional regulator with XRE-family HTH domain
LTQEHRDIDAVVGARLRKARLAARMSQTELGDAIGVSFQQVQKYERAANRLSASMLVLAARAVGVPAARLLQDLDGDAPVDAGAAARLERAEALLPELHQVPNLTADQLVALRQLFRIFADQRHGGPWRGAVRAPLAAGEVAGHG